MDENEISSNESNCEDDVKVMGEKADNIWTVQSKSVTAQSENSSKWDLCKGYEEVLSNVQFRPGQNPRPLRTASDMKQPIDFFKLFFTNELAGKIIFETNEYARRKINGKTLSPNSTWRSWLDVTMEEFWAFIAVVINMGAMPLSSLQEYWSRNPVSYIPFYSDTFKRDRFSQIFWMLRLKTISTRNSTSRMRLQEVSGFLDSINSKFLDYFTPGEHICVRDSMLKFKGRISFTARNPKKPTKSAIRVCTLADSKTGFISCILPYYGPLTKKLLIRPDLPVSSRIPIHLYKMLLEKIPGAQGHHIYTDHTYTSYALARELAKMKCNITGMISANRKELPEEIKKSNFWEKSTVAYRRDDTLLIGCKDKRIFTCLTTKGNTGMSTVKRVAWGGTKITVHKPTIILDYRKYTRVFDRGDHRSSMYCFLQKSPKWWLKLFFEGIHICVVNSYILHKLKTKEREKPLSFLQFQKTLVEQLRGSFRQRRDKASASHSDVVRLNNELHIVMKGPKRDCKVCSNRSTPGGRREVTYYCDTCPDKPRMHLGPCFTKYHTELNYRV